MLEAREEGRLIGSEVERVALGSSREADVSSGLGDEVI